MPGVGRLLFMNLIEQIDRHEYLYLTEIGEPEDNVLRLVIEEVRASGEPEDMKIGDVTLSGARSIISDEHCFAYEVVFGSYVAYSVRNESYVGQDVGGENSPGVGFAPIQSRTFWIMSAWRRSPQTITPAN